MKANDPKTNHGKTNRSKTNRETATAEADVPEPGPQPVAARPAELAGLLEALPESLEQILAHPARHQPAVVERLVDRGREMLSQYEWQAYYVADAARLVAAELPPRWPREERFRLRAGSLELWGMVQRRVGEPPAAEAAWLSAIELLAKTDAEAPDLAVLLGRCALLASDHGNEEDLTRYALEAARITRAADRGWPLPTFLHLWNTLMAEPKKWESAVTLAKALFRAVWEAWGGFADKPWEMSLEIVDRGNGRCEIRLDRKGPLGFLPDWTLDEPVVYRWGKRPPQAESAGAAKA